MGGSYEEINAEEFLAELLNWLYLAALERIWILKATLFCPAYYILVTSTSLLFHQTWQEYVSQCVH